jgi:dolichol kinase
VNAIDWPRVTAFVAAVVAVWLVTGALKAAGRLPCDIARKINHVVALAGGAVCFGWLPLETAKWSIYAVAAILVSLVVVVCAFRGTAPFRYAFLANTRRSDAPHEAFYFWSSWVVSAAGLVGIHLIWDDIVVTRTAALLVGIGDGIAEPIGRRWGRHKYRVRSLTGGKPAERSLEGSAAVFVGCLFTLLACFGTDVMAGAVTLALLLTVVEAVR